MWLCASASVVVPFRGLGVPDSSNGTDGAESQG